MIPHNEPDLFASGYRFAQGVRNNYSIAFNGDGHLFGLENSGDHDDPEELNWIRSGRHFSFPWYAGGTRQLLSA